jgi:hypothetical protein
VGHASPDRLERNSTGGRAVVDHPKCKTCLHFIVNLDAWDLPPNFGACGLVEMACNMTDYDFVAEKNTAKPEYKDHLAAVMDGSSYRAELYASPEFYCAMHSDLMPHLCDIQP